MHSSHLGRFLFAIGLAGLGLLSLLSQDFALSYQPVPAEVPGRPLLATFSGAILLAGSLGMAVRRTASHATLALTLFVLSWQFVLHAPKALAHPGHVGSWLNFSENILLAAGGWLIFLSIARSTGRPHWAATAGPHAFQAGWVIFALSLPVVGLSHFVYVDITASMVPGWLPFRHGFAYLTGIGHIAAALGILLGILRPLAASLEALMISLFILGVHVPGVALDPGSRVQWTMLFAATAFAGAAWGVAGSLREKSPPAT